MTHHAPCKKCENRSLGCHSMCDKYLKFKKQRNELNDKKVAQGLIDSYFFEKFNKRMKNRHGNK